MKPLVTATLLMCIAMSSSCRSPEKSGTPEPGTELYAVAPDAITEVLISSQAHKIYAYRLNTDRPFQLVVASGEAPAAEQCSSGVGFARLLQAVASMPIVKKADKQFDERGADWTELRLRDTISLEPIEARIRIPRTNGEPVVIQFVDRQYVVRADPASLRMSRS